MRLLNKQGKRLIRLWDSLRAELNGLPVGTKERVYKHREIEQVEADLDSYLS